VWGSGYTIVTNSINTKSKSNDHHYHHQDHSVPFSNCTTSRIHGISKKQSTALKNRSEQMRNIIPSEENVMIWIILLLGMMYNNVHFFVKLYEMFIPFHYSRIIGNSNKDIKDRDGEIITNAMCNIFVSLDSWCSPKKEWIVECQNLPMKEYGTFCLPNYFHCIKETQKLIWMEISWDDHSHLWNNIYIYIYIYII
jgi:hypothetical protein